MVKLFFFLYLDPQNLKKSKTNGNSPMPLDFPHVLACFPLVSDGPMVRDLCN